ncbi:UDP-3-O-(3-hydroxymyristoyl)glucosamine N-acyltransferase [Syntrophotalea acetylenivorans]|uniref:UDP-3-O-acylglucosamine N-acyltransferase n=1 Tax=Syntrophotalea acetylenivorans TaxID=1842532 RepID=A0A1L3GL03_9BACT|nr:UDP-3-O-(3-hydroxymyristoyl)glucosamine N-acyltransferase [Syntrophotalea acetylenivorans]APG26626.1 UDP-3-O-(3-hydroxymyristoyl)glucosamine N-acyltransferase [Syntrophotalea acetylenivorans]
MKTLKELADLIGGTVVGDGDAEIHRVAGIDSAKPGEITFLANPKYLPLLKTTQASAVMVTPGVEAPGVSLLVCPNPYLAFAKVLTALHVAKPEYRGIMEGAYVDPEAKIADGVTIHPGCVIGKNVSVGSGTTLYPGVLLYDNVTVGEDCLIHAGTVVREGCRLGNRVIVQPKAVIGSDGFGFAPDGSSYFKIPQVGIVVIEDDVEIGANSCLDRAALGETRIGRGTKIDNLVQIAHNVKIGADSIIVSQVGIAGSTEIGKHCTLGGQVGVAGHIKVGDNTMVGAQSGVTGNMPGGEVISGTPAIPHRDWLKAATSFSKLPEMRKEIKKLKKQVEELQELTKEG